MGRTKFVLEQITICSEEFSVYLCTNKIGWLTMQTQEHVKDAFLSTEIEGKARIVFLWKLTRFIKQNKIDIVITNSANAGFYGRLAAFLPTQNLAIILMDGVRCITEVRSLVLY